MPYFTSLGVLERVILQVLWAWECAFWGGLMGCRGRLILEKVLSKRILIIEKVWWMSAFIIEKV